MVMTLTISQVLLSRKIGIIGLYNIATETKIHPNFSLFDLKYPLAMYDEDIVTTHFKI
jgi:hypothetical protein